MKKQYVSPAIEVVELNVESQILAGSDPGVGFEMTVEPPGDGGEEEIELGAKESDGWGEW